MTANFDIFYLFKTILNIFFYHFWHFLPFLTFLTIFDHFWQFLTIFDNLTIFDHIWPFFDHIINFDQYPREPFEARKATLPDEFKDFPPLPRPSIFPTSSLICINGWRKMIILRPKIICSKYSRRDVTGGGSGGGDCS